MTDTPYFSDRELGPKPRIKEKISQSAWGGIIAVIKSHIADGSFGYRYPLNCQDGEGPCGCDGYTFALALAAEIPEFAVEILDIQLQLNPNKMPSTLAILDLLEFCHRAVGKPTKGKFHSYYNHSHLNFEPKEGQAIFRDEINRILARNELAYELRPDGLVVRLAPEPLREVLASAKFQTGDTKLDSLLETARAKYLDPDINVRLESLEKLWDAWERLKTIEPGKDKKESITILLDRAATELTFRGVLEKEASELTRIGNSFGIRHSETTQVSLELSEHADYLFHRMFALIRLLLRTAGRDIQF